MNNNSTEYNSAKDTLEHKINVSKVFSTLNSDLTKRITMHDASKLKSPELEGYNKFIPMLKTAKYGSSEYEEIRSEMQKGCLQHHYDENRHHPEHFENGIHDFTIVDLFEYFCDTYAASLKSDTPYSKGLEVNAKKHKLPEELVKIFENTVKEYF